MHGKKIKLVRDLIPDIMREQGKEVVCYCADDAEYRVRLKEKLLEEVTEFLEEENIEEMADIAEVLEAICAIYGFDPAQIMKTRIEKNEKRGKFEKRIISQF